MQDSDSSEELLLRLGGSNDSPLHVPEPTAKGAYAPDVCLMVQSFFQLLQLFHDIALLPGVPLGGSL